MKLIGYITSAVVISLVIIGLNSLCGNNFIPDFIKNDALTISTTLMGFNIAVHTILIGQITDVEIYVQRIGLFKNTRKELKDNALFNVFLLVLIFFLKLLKFDKDCVICKSLGLNLITKINFAIDVIIMSAIVMIVCLIIETIKSVYKVYEFKETKAK